MHHDSTSSSLRRVSVIAGMALTEARRNRLPWIVLAMAAVVLASSLFARSLALTESARLQVALLASFARVAAAFVVCLHVIGSALREQQDRITDYLLSVDLPRGVYLAGKAAGYMMVALAVAIVFWMPVAAYAPGVPVFAWLLSLVLELWIVAASAVFCAVTLNHFLLGTAFVMGLYVLSRTMSSLVLIATASPFLTTDATQQALAAVLRGIALLLPDLERFTRSGWLAGSPPDAAVLLSISLEAMTYIVLLLAAALVDLYRKNL